MKAQPETCRLIEESKLVVVDKFEFKNFELIIINLFSALHKSWTEKT